jgi:hypothetical protein
MQPDCFPPELKTLFRGQRDSGPQGEPHPQGFPAKDATRKLEPILVSHPGDFEFKTINAPEQGNCCRINPNHGDTPMVNTTFATNVATINVPAIATLDPAAANDHGPEADSVYIALKVNKVSAILEFHSFTPSSSSTATHGPRGVNLWKGERDVLTPRTFQYG